MWAGHAFKWPLDQSQLAKYAAESAVGRRRIWMVEDSMSAHMIGHASLLIDTARASGRLGRVLVAPRARGRGYGTAMLDTVLAVAFRELKLERVDLGVFTHNMNAIRLYERSGFISYSVLPNVIHVDGHWWSSMEMTMRRASYET
jgi:RimJ/RimL family protein N-acetyltransferase